MNGRTNGALTLIKPNQRKLPPQPHSMLIKEHHANRDNSVRARSNTQKEYLNING
jgi:hypothetical protein